jgi:twitching motility protein PilJ
MGFFDKLKGATDQVSTTNSDGFVGKIRNTLDATSETFGDRDRAKPFIQMGLVCAVVSFVLLLVLAYSVPRNKTLTESLGDLRLLSQMISRQATEATASGSDESIKKLKTLQQQFLD